MNKKTILMINDHISFGGGGDANFRLERRILESAGYEVFTFSHEIDAEPYRRVKDFVYRESQSKIIRKIGKFIFSPGTYIELKKIIRKINPCLIRLHLISKYPASIYAAVKGYPVVQTLHGPNLICATGWGCLKNTFDDCKCGIGVKCYINGCVPLTQVVQHTFLYILDKYLAKRSVKLFTTPSRHLRDTMINLGFQNTEYLPICIDDYFMSEPFADKKDPDPTLIFVGTLTLHKGVDILLRAFSTILNRVPNARLILAGRNSRSYIPLAKKLRIDNNVEFLGFVSHKDIRSVYARGHIFIMPSLWKEQFGLVGIEALSCGLPCIGTNIGGIPEWLKDNEHGFLVPPADEKALAEKVVYLMTEQAKASHFGSIGRKFVLEHFDPETFRRNILEVVTRFERHNSIGFVS